MINIVLYQPEISPNTGNIIRSCYATGSKLHIIKPTSFDIHPKWLKRPAAGIHLTEIPHEIHASFQDFWNKYHDQTIFYVTRYGQQEHTAPDYSQYQNQDIFLMFGRESTGLPFDLLKNHLDKCVRIPMVPNARSLNLANSVILMIYEVQRQLKFPNLSTVEVIKGKDWIKKNR